LGKKGTLQKKKKNGRNNRLPITEQRAKKREKKPFSNTDTEGGDLCSTNPGGGKQRKKAAKVGGRRGLNT